MYIHSQVIDSGDDVLNKASIFYELSVTNSKNHVNITSSGVIWIMYTYLQVVDSGDSVARARKEVEEATTELEKAQRRMVKSSEFVWESDMCIFEYVDTYMCMWIYIYIYIYISIHIYIYI